MTDHIVLNVGGTNVDMCDAYECDDCPIRVACPKKASADVFDAEVRLSLPPEQEEQR
jgi:hypothetical protein